MYSYENETQRNGVINSMLQTLRENRVTLLTNFNNTCPNELQYACPNEFSPSLDDVSSKQALPNVNPMKIAISCPNCFTMLGVQVTPSRHSHSDLVSQFQKHFYPGESGDISTCKDYKDKQVLNLLNHLNPREYHHHKANNMSYVVLKGYKSSPHSTTISAATDKNSRNLCRYRERKLDPTGKSDILLKAGKTYQCLATEHQAHKKDNHLIRSKSYTKLFGRQSFFVENASLYARSSLPLFQNIENQVGLSGYDPNDNYIFEDIPLKGIDKEDIATLYDSSSTSSQYSMSDSCGVSIADTSDLVIVNSGISHKASNQTQTSLTNQSGDAGPPPTSPKVDNEWSMTEKSQTTTSHSPTFINNNNIPILEKLEGISLLPEIPEFRQDLYKDCLTLFLEKWFGRQGTGTDDGSAKS